MTRLKARTPQGRATAKPDAGATTTSIGRGARARIGRVWVGVCALSLMASACDGETGPDGVVPVTFDAAPSDAGPAPDAALPDLAPEPDAALPDMAPEPDAAPQPMDHPLDVMPDVPPAGPYGTRTITVPAETNWAATGLYLRAGETVTITAAGQWSRDGVELGPEGDERLGEERGCPIGSLAARTDLWFEDTLVCIGAGGDMVAARDGPVYVGMVESTDLGEAYAERLGLDGAVEVTLTSDGATVPMVRIDELPGFDLDAVESGVVELVGQHVFVVSRTEDIARDAETAEAAIATLDAIWEDEADLRGNTPFSGQRIRFAEDPTIVGFAYMLAGNPIRCVPPLFDGTPEQRILRAAEPATDIWGFAHEMGHVFSLANGTWVYQYNNVESFPNIFTIHALETLDRTANQPNIDTYCNGRDAWFEGGEYSQFKDDPFLQLCFLMVFTETYGWDFWRAFFEIIARTPTNPIPIGGQPEHANTWGFLRDTFGEAAGEDVTAVFDAWRVPLPE